MATHQLLNDSDWKHRIGKGWKGKKILGSGAYGTAALWEYEGSEGAAPAIKQIVVKQTKVDKSDNRADWEIEGRLMETLASVRSRHILRMYGPARKDSSYGRDMRRLFLEYCPGGDMEKLLEADGRKQIIPTRPFLEVDIWTMFYCMALGVAVMHRGTEDPNAEAWVRTTEIVHYDINPRNGKALVCQHCTSI
jgi:serine/threonine protein kinase